MIDQATVPQVELQILRGRAQRMRRAVESRAFLIGTSCDCDLVLTAKHFPEVYAYLVVRPDSVSIRHLGLGPQLVVNGRPVTDARLADGDRIGTGPFEFMIHIAWSSRTEPADIRPFSRQPTSRWISKQGAVDMGAMTSAMRLIDDIRTALAREPQAMRRPA